MYSQEKFEEKLTMADDESFWYNILLPFEIAAEYNKHDIDNGGTGTPIRVAGDHSNIWHGFEMLRVRHHVLGNDLYMVLQDNTIKFKARADGKEFKLIDVVLPDWTQPYTWGISVPSKKLVFRNFFPDTINPEPPDQYSREWSLDSYVGMKKRSTFYAHQNGVGYGQMGNMSIEIFSNGMEIIIVSPYLQSSVDDYEYCLEEGDDDLEFEKEQAEKALVILNYLKDNGFESKGTICLDMWRYECIDYDRLQSHIANGGIELYGSDEVIVELQGDKVYAEHYYQSYSSHPTLGHEVYAHIKVVTLY